MADSPNTPTLPKIHSRRAALAGIAGTLALATGAVCAVTVQSTAQHNPDAELIALCERYLREWADYDACLGREMDAESVARDNEPHCPPELYETLQFADGPKEPSHAPRCNERPYWSRNALEEYAEPDSKTMLSKSTKGPEGEFIYRNWYAPAPEATRTRCRELLVVYDRWQAEIDATEIEWRRPEELSSEQSDRCSETLEGILEHEPETLAGLAALAKLALEGGMFDDGGSEEYTAVKRTILEVVVRFGGGSVS